ncbi:hypothetical protein [Roseinatronobacter monicus]|uniref:Uncharacterized protein n=1 Tax=Roseinatronobacter monicus TaxID=393481 RepID=A0A543KE64_9RHOB|nr:hypothetical protein [Roseinatronobacter monicus]TQM93368.1 hypothetical protein BD293_2001 [Roseinatronobacter monicus]
MTEQISARLVAALNHLAQTRHCITYGALAAQIGLDGPGRIRRLTDLLEALMEEDAARGRPLRAALVTGKASGGVPAPGFFLKASALGLCPYPLPPERAKAFHDAQLEALFAAS